MKKFIFVLVFVVIGISLITTNAQAALFYDTRSAWITAVGGVYDSVDIGGQVPEYNTLTAGTPLSLPYSYTLAFDIDLQGLQVSSGWATWSGGNTPAVLYTLGGTSVTGAFGPGGVYSYGLEMEPNIMSEFEMTLLLSDGTSLSQMVHGDSGASFFGWKSDIAVDSMTLSCDGSDFAFGRMVIAEPYVIPEPATMSLLGIGLLGLFGIRKRKKI